VSAEIKREKDGGYTISTEGNVALGASVGVEDPSGNEASGDLMLGGGGKMEFKVDPVIGEDGQVDEVATKAKVKELTEAIARTAAAGSTGPVGSQIADAVIGPTAAQKDLMKASFKGVELKGQAALALAAKLNLPGMATLEGSARVSQEFTLRIEKGDTGLAVSVKQTLAGEAEVQGGLSPGVPGVQGTAGVKGTAKVELEQKFEFPGSNTLGEVVSNLGKVPPVVTNTLTLSTDVQGGVGATVGGETGVADGTAKVNGRLGVTTEVKLTAPNDPAVLRKVIAQTLEGKLADAARTAGDQTEIEVKTTVYAERQRQVNGIRIRGDQQRLAERLVRQHLGKLRENVEVLLGGLLGHQQENHQRDRLAIGCVKGDGLRHPHKGGNGVLEPLDPSMRDRHALAEPGRAEALARKQAVEHLGAGDALMVPEDQPGLPEGPVLAGFRKIPPNI